MDGAHLVPHPGVLQLERLSDRETEDACGHARAAASPQSTSIAVVGTGTARAVREQLGCEPDLVAAGSGAALLELPQLAHGPATSRRRLLLPGSALASPRLAAGLSAAGWEVDAVAAYTMVPVAAAELPEGFAADWAGGGFAAVVLVAGSSTRALVEAVGPPPPATHVVAIGKPTAAAARASGVRVDAVAAAPTPAGIRDAMLNTLITNPRRPTP
ncbi:uroporphyrinogen-III synthase [Actinomyces ruminis]|uniref:uroporphyrinogen-III synthase n=1 Tax=Actinomyces ruminis TaxID=1937003 RepID=UPI00211E908B|nr:uroporphyrinogen-III synthase [Actinomyces ruminis]